VEHSFSPIETAVRPWRTATLVAVAVAAVELVLLVVVGGALFSKPNAAPARKSASASATKHASAATAPRQQPPAAKAELPRSKVSVLVLNGNGRTGAAAATAERASGRGYRIKAVANAASSDFTRSLVMYRQGFAGEATRLARDLGITIVGPLDGMRANELHGAKVVLIVGA
jgi:hypothetical protein